MQKSLRIIPLLRPSIEKSAKTMELRIPTNRNTWLIEQMRSYRTGEIVRIVFGESQPLHKPIDVRITKPTEIRQLGELTDDEIRQIVGLTKLTREQLMRFLCALYNPNIINEKTNAYLAHFELAPNL